MKQNEKEIDEYVGVRLKARRKSVGLSQKDLADELGFSFQQIQKYEKGVNRIGSGKLFRFAHILGVDISYFFDGFDESQTANQVIARINRNYVHTDVSPRVIEDLITSFSRLDPELRKKVLGLVKQMSN